jgi:chloride channel protein, CIC family
VLTARQTHRELAASSLLREPVTAHADETLRTVADRMVSSGHGVLPVVDHSRPQRLVGLVSQFDLLRAHERVLVEERRRERSLTPYRLAGGLGALLPTREAT